MEDAMSGTGAGMGKKVVVGLIILAIVVWAGYSLFAGIGGSSNSGPIKIGFIGPLTGDNANLGQNAKAATEIAVGEINAAGGVEGRSIEMVYEDGGCTGRTASDAASKLINVDHVPVILGGACSGETLAFAGAAEQAKTVVLSYCSSNPSITNAGDYIFRDYPSDSFQGAYAADYIFNTLGKKKVAIVYVKTDWGVGIRQVFEDKYKALGGQIVASEGFDQNSRDLRTQLTKAKGAKPELLYFLGYTEESVVGLKQAAELKFGVPIFGGDAWSDPKIFQEAGRAGEGAMYSVVNMVNPADFKTKMKAKTGSDEIIVCTPGAYDGIKIVAQVMNKVGTDATAIKNALYGVSYAGGVSSPTVSFDANGDLKGASYVVKAVHAGKAVEVK